MQEQIERESLALSVKATKLTAQTLAKVLGGSCKWVGKKFKEAEAEVPHGKQSIKDLMKQNVPTNTIEIEGDKGLFEQVARKWHVDYAFHKTGKDSYLLLFKSSQADAMTACFSEYSKRVMKRAKDKRPPIKEQAEKAAKRAERDKTKHKNKERTRTREAARE